MIHQKTLLPKTLIVVVGPTAIGKTAMGIHLAQHFKCEIISCDSRQFYKEMKIGTAVPSDEELNSAKHHFIQHISIKDEYNVGQFEKDALNCLGKLFESNDYAIMVGGSGLYVDAVCNGLDVFPNINKTTKTLVQSIFETKGIEGLQETLLEYDPITYNKIDLQNKQRVLRAVEICIESNKPYSSFLAKEKTKRNFNIIKIGITADREKIYERINKRVHIMIEEGLVEEVKKLYDHKNTNALNTVGYKEIFKYIDKEWSFDFAISEIQKNTRRYAKRQLTWWRKDENIQWVNFDDSIEKVLSKIGINSNTN